MIKSILVGLDNSIFSESALKLGSQIAKASSTSLKGLFIEDTSKLLDWKPYSQAGMAIGVSSGLPQPLPSEMQVEIEQQFKEDKNFARLSFNSCCQKENIEGSFSSSRGQVDKILASASKTVDLVIVGKNGKDDSTKKGKPGIHLNGLIANSTSPLLIANTYKQKISRILLAYDGSDSSSRVLRTCAVLAKILNAKLHVLYVSKDSDEVEVKYGEARSYLNNCDINLDVIYISNLDTFSAEQGILEQSQLFESDLIAMGTHGENYLKDIVFGTTTKQILEKTKCNLLLSK